MVYFVGQRDDYSQYSNQGNSGNQQGDSRIPHTAHRNIPIKTSQDKCTDQRNGYGFFEKANPQGQQPGGTYSE